MPFHKRMTCQQPVTILVAGPNGRTAFRYQNFSDETGKGRHGLLTGDPSNSTAEITIVDANFGTIQLSARSVISFLIAPPVTNGLIIDINGTNLVGFNGARTSGNDDFNINASPLQTEIIDAINDVANSFAANYVASAYEDFVILTTVATGYVTNTDTISSSIPGEISVSPFSGGGQTEGWSTITIGDRNLVSGVDWEVVETDPALSAASLAASISRIPGYSATALANVISILGPNGDSFNPEFSALQDGPVPNFVLVPGDGKVQYGTQSIGAVEIIK